MENNAGAFQEKGGEQQLVVRELDENGFHAKTYEGSRPADMTMRSVQQDATGRRLKSSAELAQSLINVFLPTGYPKSVRPDYVNYQIYDSIQAFSSSIAQLFANRCVLAAVGVGDESATSTSALFMKIIQDAVGRLGTILYAWKLGSALEPECKKYRFMADLVNDAAMVFDCMSPMFPGDRRLRVGLLCISGLLRSVCGVLAGGSRAALTLHFTTARGSVGDVNAKDQSQETVISLMGMLAGSIVVGAVTGEGLQMWTTVLFLLAIHLWTNYQAVSHVVMVVLSRQRANIVFSDIVNALPDIERTAKTDVHSAESVSRLILSPTKVAAKERILEPDGLLRWYNPGRRNDVILGHADFVGFDKLVRAMPASISLGSVFEACESKESGYVLYYGAASGGNPFLQSVGCSVGGVEVYICLLADIKTISTYHQAWVHSLVLAKKCYDAGGVIGDPLQLIRETRSLVRTLFVDLRIEESLRHAGWESWRCAIERTPTPTIQLSM